MGIHIIVKGLMEETVLPAVMEPRIILLVTITPVLTEPQTTLLATIILLHLVEVVPTVLRIILLVIIILLRHRVVTR